MELLPDGERVRAAFASIVPWPRLVAKISLAIAVVVVGTGLAAVVSSTQTVSVPAVLAATLGLQTLTLLAWIAALVPGLGSLLRRAMSPLVAGPMRTLGSLRDLAASAGAAALPDAAADWSRRRTRRMEIDHAARIAATNALALAYDPRRSNLTALVYGVWSNLAWVMANALMIGLLSLHLLGSRNYTLHSGLLSPEVTRAWIESMLAMLDTIMPAAMLPDAAALARASVEPAGVATDSWKWGSMLVCSVIVFGWFPRCAALCASTLWLRTARRRWRIPWHDRAMGPTRAVIEAAKPPTTVVATERSGTAASVRGTTVRSADGAYSAASRAEAPALLRIGGVTPWTPTRAATALGSLEEGGLAGAEAIAARIRGERLGPILLLVDLSSAPRRGVIDYLSPIVDAAPCAAVLSEGARLRRGMIDADFATVVRSWRSLLEQAGAVQVHELDLGLRTSASGAMLEALVSGHAVRPTAAGRLSRAFERIGDAERDLAQRIPRAAEERQLVDSLGTIYGIERLSERAPFVLRLGADDRAAWHSGLDQARHAVTGGPALKESALGESARRELLASATQLAVELEFQGCGEVAISRRLALCREILDESREPANAAVLSRIAAAVSAAIGAGADSEGASR